jgi:SAM-dependent methyltransferase
MDHRTDPRHLFDEVFATPDHYEFVRRAYRLVLRREASDHEIRRRGRMLKYVPFYTRDRFMRRLLQSPEAGLIGRATVAAGEALLQQGAVRDHQVQESLSAIEARLQQAVAGLKGRVLQAVGEADLKASNAAVETARAVAGTEARVLQAVWKAEAAIGAQSSNAAQLSAALAQLTELVAVANARLADSVAVGVDSRAVAISLLQVLDAARHEQRAGFDQLRRLGSVTADKVGAAVPPADRPAAPAVERCRVCGGAVEFRFRLPVLHDRYEAEYHECRECHTLQILHPHWLAEAYAGEAAAGPWNPDQGRFARNFSVFQLLRGLLDAGLGGGRQRVLDFGGGYGLFTQMLYSAGLDAWGYDPYVPHPYLATNRTVADPTTGPAGAFDVVSALEVFEHLTDPDAVGQMLQHAVAPGGAVLITTGLYDPATHGPDWPYLSAVSGQHVTLWSRAGLVRFAGRFGFKSVGYAVGGGLPAVVLSQKEPGELKAIIARAEQALADPQYRATATGPWMLNEPYPPQLQGAVDATS